MEKGQKKRKGFGGKPSPEEHANIFSKLTFWWANEYVSQFNNNYHFHYYTNTTLLHFYNSNVTIIAISSGNLYFVLPTHNIHISH